MTLICSTGKENNLENLENRINHKADYHEIRMELYPGREDEILRLATNKKIIFTFSFFQNKFSRYFARNRQLFGKIAQFSDYYCDIDYKFLDNESNFKKLTAIIPVTRIIASGHFYEYTSLASIFTTVDKINKMPCTGGKIAVKINSCNQLLELRKIQFNKNIRVVIAMGKVGRISRFKPSFFNANLTYGYCFSKFRSSREQPSLQSLELGRIFDEDKLEVLALAGGKLISQSPSYQFYNHLFSKLNLRYHYLKIQIFREYQLEAFCQFPFKGLCVTMPLKKSSFFFKENPGAKDNLTRELHDSVVNTRAVNTLVFERRKRVVQLKNTDYLAFQNIFSKNLPFDDRFNKIALVLGNGAAAQSCLAALPFDYNLVTGCRNPTKATSDLDFLLKKRKNKYTIKKLEQLQNLKPVIVVNTLPVNLSCQVWNKILAKYSQMLVIDLLMENKAQTNLVKLCPKEKNIVINGHDFWLQQGFLQLSHFLPAWEFTKIKNACQYNQI
ncbi:MAG: type I 3-dehydroquinate dehydratase [Myxococcota bacterium]